MPLFTNPPFDGKGHLVSPATSGTPTLSAVNANVTNQTVTGDDVRGTFNFDVITGTIAIATVLFTVTFAQAYSATPIVMLTTGPSNKTNGGFYYTASAAGSFILRTSAAVAVSTGYQVSYEVIG